MIKNGDKLLEKPASECKVGDKLLHKNSYGRLEPVEIFEINKIYRGMPGHKSVHNVLTPSATIIVDGTLASVWNEQNLELGVLLKMPGYIHNIFGHNVAHHALRLFYDLEYYLGF